MASLRAILGIYPKTADIEAKWAALEKEFEELNAYVKSDELTEFSELDKTVPTKEFDNCKKEIKSQKYKDTEEYRKEKEFNILQKDSEIKNYFKILSSAELKKLTEFETSDDLKKYHKLEEFIKSEKYSSVKKYMALPSKIKFEQSELFQKLRQYTQQNKSVAINNYYKVVKDKAFNDYKNLADSKKIKEFDKLEKFITSGKVEQVRQTVNKQEYKQSDEYLKLLEYKQLLKSNDIKNYKKITGSPCFRDFEKLYSSNEIETFEELQKYILSGDYKRERNKIEKSKFKDTPEYQKEQEYLNLKKSAWFKNNFSFKSSKNYQSYLSIENSEKLKKYETLKEYVKTDKFLKKKEYMLLPGIKKYELSDECMNEKRYYELKKSDKIKWYFKVKDSDKFNQLRQWEKTFEEDFDAAKLDRKKWMTRYFWGDNILKDTYSLAHEKQYISDGKNLEISNSVLKIITRSEKATGKAWNPKIGFFPKEFDYTSGLINTGSYFRQKYGIFEAKIKFNKNYPVNHAFWMISDKMLPHIDIAKAQKKLIVSNLWGNITENNGVKKKISKYSLSRFTSDYYIYRLEWTQERLTWKINNITVATSTEGIPQDPMYIVISSALYSDVNGATLPASMDIDWVRCYQAVK